MHSKSGNIEIRIYDKAYEVIEQLFDCVLYRYQTALEELSKCSDFIFDCVKLLHYRCHKIKSETWWIIYIFSRLDKKQKNNSKFYRLSQ